MIYPPDYSSGGLFLGLLGHFSILHFSHPISHPIFVFLFSSFFFFFVMFNTIIIGAAINNVKKNKYPIMNMICVVPDSNIISVYSFRFLLNYTSFLMEVQAWTF